MGFGVISLDLPPSLSSPLEDMISSEGLEM
jgi:hypothetical protein